MSVCGCFIIGVGNSTGRYGIGSMLEQINWTDMYNCVGSNIFGLSVVVFPGIGIGYGTGWEE